MENSPNNSFTKYALLSRLIGENLLGTPETNLSGRNTRMARNVRKSMLELTTSA